MKREEITRDVTISCVKTALNQAVDYTDADLFTEADPRAVIDYARKHQVLALLQSALSNSEIARFFGGYSASVFSEFEANKSRNQTIRRQTREAGSAMEKAGIRRIVVLKGVAFLFDGFAAWTDHRFMTDVDFLIHPEDLSESVRVMKSLGYSANDEEYDPITDPHYPAFTRGSDEVPLEVHTRLGPPIAETVLDSNCVYERSLPIADAFPLRVPSGRNRLVHLILHAQIYSNRYKRRQFLLRDAVDYFRLLEKFDTDLTSVRTQFVATGYEDLYDGFVSMCEFVGQEDNRCTIDLEHPWASETFAVMASRRREKAYLIADWGSRLARGLLSAGSWNAAKSTLINPARRRRRFKTWKDRLAD